MLKVTGKSDKELKSIELFKANRQVAKVCIKVATKEVTLGNLSKIPLFIHLDLP